ncbi:MAG TPA: MASE3 domain-containing protein, partial [Rectinemataceae bacterium]|nr:MASE3 domain-containing protein [Rectinemataceae bacterium]
MIFPKRSGASSSGDMAGLIESPLSGGAAEALIFTIVLALLVTSRLGGYLLFHSLAELFSICIAATYFVIALHTRKLNENPSIAALGISYLFVAVLDTFHVLSYAGMGVFQGGGYPANQVWILARFLEALSLLLFTFIRRTEGRSLFFIFVIGTIYAFAGL